MRNLVVMGVAIAGLAGFAMPLHAASPDPATHPAEQSPLGAQPTDARQQDDDASLSKLKTKFFDIDVYIRAAEKNGYQPSIIGQPGDRQIVLKLTKIGKTTNGYGILQKKWDQRDTIDLTLGKRNDGFYLEGVSRNVAIKPPIGDWITQPSKDVPAWVFPPSLTSG